MEQMSLARQAQALLSEAENAYQTDRQKAKFFATDCVTICRQLDDPWRLAQVLELLGRIHQLQGRLTEAQKSLEEAFALWQTLADKRGMGTSLRNLSNLARWMGKFEEAEEQIRRSIAIFVDLNDPEQLALSAHTMHGILVYGGKYTESVRLFEEPGIFYKESDLLDKPKTPTIVSAFALMHLGHYELAAERFKETLAIYPRNAIGYAVKNLGRIALVQEDLERAQTHLLEALSLFRNAEDMNGLGQTLGCLGITELRLGNLSQAQKYMDENLSLATNTLIFLPSMVALTGIALLRAEQRDAESSIELYTTALQNGHVANSHWYSDVTKQMLDVAIGLLPPEVIIKAEARGKERTWQFVLAEL